VRSSQVANNWAKTAGSGGPGSPLPARPHADRCGVALAIPRCCSWWYDIGLKHTHYAGSTRHQSIWIHDSWAGGTASTPATCGCEHAARCQGSSSHVYQ